MQRRDAPLVRRHRRAQRRHLHGALLGCWRRGLGRAPLRAACSAGRVPAASALPGAPRRKPAPVAEQLHAAFAAADGQQRRARRSACSCSAGGGRLRVRHCGNAAPPGHTVKGNLRGKPRPKGRQQ